jgi:hypothetical protein
MVFTGMRQGIFLFGEHHYGVPLGFENAFDQPRGIRDIVKGEYVCHSSTPLELSLKSR